MNTASPRQLHRSRASVYGFWRFTGVWDQSEAGFTLLELIVTLVIVSILVAIGIPSLVTLIEHNRATVKANEFVTALNTARSAAVTRRTTVSVCTSADGNTCRAASDPDFTSWSKGWIIIDDRSNEVISVHPSLDGQFTLTGDTNRVAYDSSGATTAGSILNFSLNIPNCIGDLERDIEIGPTGRVSVNRQSCTDS